MKDDRERDLKAGWDENIQNRGSRRVAGLKRSSLEDRAHGGGNRLEFRSDVTAEE
jgi:hypothetical protein